MSGTVIGILMLVGTFFMFVASVGICRMPDLFMRLSANTKASTLGASLLLAGSAIYFNDYDITSRIVAIIGFIVLTTPVAAHMLGRAAYMSNVPLWEGTICDELRGRYDIERRVLENPPEREEGEERGCELEAEPEGEK